MKCKQTMCGHINWMHARSPQDGRRGACMVTQPTGRGGRKEHRCACPGFKGR